MAVNSDDKTQKKLALKKGVGLPGGISIVVGIIIGSGIFITPQGVAKGTGSIGLCLLTWTLCGAISLIGGLCYCELGMLLQQSGGELAYLDAAFGRAPAFIFAWLSLFIRPAACAATTMTCAQYLIVLYIGDGCTIPPVAMKLLALTILWVGAFINWRSVRITMRIQIFFTIAKVTVLILIILGGIYKLILGSTDILASGFSDTETNAGKIILGAYGGLYAYDGWNCLNFVYEEIKQPEKNLPRAVIFGLLTVTVIYVMANVSYFTVLPMKDLIASPAVVVSWANQIVPRYISWIVPVAVAFSAYGGFNGQLFTSGRVCFVAGRKGLLVNILSMIHIKYCTPLPAILLTSCITSVFVLQSDILALVNFMSFLLWFFYGFSIAALLVLRVKLPYKKYNRPFRVPTWLAVMFLILACVIVFVPIILQPQMELVYAIIFMICGLFLYFPFVYFGKELPCMDKFTKFLQTLLLVAPEIKSSSDSDEDDD